MSRGRIVLSFVLGMFAVAGKAITLNFSTGVDALGNRLAAGTIDPRWTFDFDGGPGSTAYVGSPLPDNYVYDPFAQWLTRAPTGLSNDPGGVYELRTFFSLAGYDLSSAVLHVRYSGDNDVQTISFNESTYLPTNYGYSVLSPTFTISSGFHEMNTFVFRVNNIGSGPPYGQGGAINPVGGLVEVFVTANALPRAVPGPAAALPFALMALRRRKKALPPESVS